MKNDNKHKQKSSFKVPDGYFNSFESKLSDKLTSDDDTSNHLNTRLNTGFKTPNAYFNSLEDTIMQEIDSKESKGKVVSLINKKSLLFFSGIAAMIAIIFTLSIAQKSKVDFEDIDIVDIHSFFEGENLDLHSTEFASLLDDDNYLEELEEELIDNETIYNYLSEEDLTDDIIFVK